MADASPKREKSAPQKALEKLGLLSDIDLALHLPLRYEDETRLTPIAALRDGDTAQVQGVVSDSQVQLRPRRQLVVRLRDDSAELVLRFIHFYPSHQKALAVGARVRVRGEAASSGSRWCTRASRRWATTRRWPAR
jgi:ATP-dependent DNA helicase RecG